MVVSGEQTNCDLNRYLFYTIEMWHIGHEQDHPHTQGKKETSSFGWTAIENANEFGVDQLRVRSLVPLSAVHTPHQVVAVMQVVACQPPRKAIEELRTLHQNRKCFFRSCS